jgi:hypothetical protein
MYRLLWRYRNWLITVVLLVMAILALGLMPANGATKAESYGSCYQRGSYHVYTCVYGGGMYGFLALYPNVFYWHPKTGDLVVIENYYKSGAPGFDGTHHRVFTFSNERVIADPTWLANPSSTTPPAICANPVADLTGFACSLQEQRSAMDFEAVMAADHIGNSH